LVLYKNKFNFNPYINQFKNRGERTCRPMVVSLGPIFFKGTATHNLNEDFGPVCLLEIVFFRKKISGK